MSLAFSRGRVKYLRLPCRTIQFCVERMKAYVQPIFRRRHNRLLDPQHEHKTQVQEINASLSPRRSINVRFQLQTVFLLSLVLLSLTQVVSAQYTFPMDSNMKSPEMEVKIGVILAHTLGKPNLQMLPFGREMVMPAILHAVENLRSNAQSVLPGVRFNITEKDSKCSNSDGPIGAIDLYHKKRAHIFMGPACDYATAPVARYSGRWGIPVITAGALFESFGDKKEFPLLTRVQGGFHKVRDMFQTVLNHYNWTHFGILFSDDLNQIGGLKGECLQILRPIYSIFTKKPPYFRIKEGDIEELRKYVAALSNNSRSEYKSYIVQRQSCR